MRQCAVRREGVRGWFCKVKPARSRDERWGYVSASPRRKRQAAIFDVDGTLVDVSGVRHHVMQRQKRFDRFHGDAIDCPPNQLALEHYHRTQEAGLDILIVTARKQDWLFHTLLWLRENGIEHTEIFMRGNRDNRKDYLVKADILAQIQRHWEVQFAVDDNPNVIKLWQENGIPTITIPGWID